MTLNSYRTVTERAEHCKKSPAVSDAPALFFTFLVTVVSEAALMVLIHGILDVHSFTGGSTD